MKNKIDNLMPIYLNLNSKYKLAIWNCGMRPQSFLQMIKDIRITFRKNNVPILVIKKGSL